MKKMTLIAVATLAIIGFCFVSFVKATKTNSIIETKICDYKLGCSSVEDKVIKEQFDKFIKNFQIVFDSDDYQKVIIFAVGISDVIGTRQQQAKKAFERAENFVNALKEVLQKDEKYKDVDIKYIYRAAEKVGNRQLNVLVEFYKDDITSPLKERVSDAKEKSLIPFVGNNVVESIALLSDKKDILQNNFQARLISYIIACAIILIVFLAIFFYYFQKKNRFIDSSGYWTINPKSMLKLYKEKEMAGMTARCRYCENNVSVENYINPHLSRNCDGKKNPLKNAGGAVKALEILEKMVQGGER